MKEFKDISSVVIDLNDNLLLELMDYYGISYYKDTHSIDKICFSGILVYLFSQTLVSINIYSILYDSLSVFLAISYENIIKPAPIDFYKFPPVVKVIIKKDDSDFLLWLYNNFTNAQEIQETITNLILQTFSTSETKIWEKEKYVENKKILLICRENLSKLLKLKNPEYRSKKLLVSIKLPEKQPLLNNFAKCRLPVEGKSIKLQSPGTIIRIRVQAEEPLKETPISKGNKIYHPELYDTLIRQYTLSSNHGQSGISGQNSPDNMSPRFYKAKATNFQSAPPQKFLKTLDRGKKSRIVEKELDASLISKSNFLTKTTKRVHSSKVIRRLKKLKIHL